MTDLDPVDESAPLEPPRFTTRTLLLGVAVLGMLIAATQAYGGLVPLLLVLLALAVVAHVAGNAIGTRLRDHHRTATTPSTAPRQLEKEDYAPKTNLALRDSLGWPLIISTAAGAAAGGLAGALLFSQLDADKATWQDTLLGAAAFAALGGMALFTAAGFAQTMYRAWRQARNVDYDQSR